MRSPRWYQRAWWAVVDAYHWVTGLRIQTLERQRLEDEELARHIIWLNVLRVDVARANADKRQAQRLVVLLSEPLKDWDLADFPDPGALRRTVDYRQLERGDCRHLAGVLEAYQMLATDLAQVRMTATTNDSTRRRGWEDQPLPPPVRDYLDPRRLS